MNTRVEADVVLLADKQGRFGSVRYYRDDESLWMLIGNVVQGGIHHDGAPFFPHAARWPGFVHDGDRVLMVGLGIGEGILAILAERPATVITCVEIDPLVIELTLSLVPALREAKAAGRLEIIESDADDFLLGTDRRWDVGCADAYQRGSASWLPATMLTRLLFRCGRVVANAFGDSHRIEAAFDHIGEYQTLVIPDTNNVFYFTDAESRT